MAITTIITDIEGTTTDIRFVHDVLFPYAREALPDFIRGYHTTEAVQTQLAATADIMGQPDATLDALIDQLIQWIDEDKKITPLKALQGLVWAAGYENGDFQGHVYPDAVTLLEAWHKANITLGIFSSGSVKAQKLLFSHTTAGDLTHLFQYYFDTTTGAKKSPEAYHAIAQCTNTAPENILFLSDVIAELDAAAAAGMHTCLLAREPADEQPHPVNNATHHTTVREFRDIALGDFDRLVQ